MLRLLNFRCSFCSNPLDETQIESAWHYSMCTPRPKAPAPGADVPAAIRSRADECTARLCRRREALSAAGKNACKANAAVARELACWVWEIGCRAEGTLG